MSNQNGILYVVATPIGNLQDMSRRAEQILANVDAIYAEDTRHSKRLLNTLGISTVLKSLHDHNERDLTPALIQALTSGKNLALISDAGTPLISDPGYFLVQQVKEQGITVCPIPGPSALITALSAAGMPTSRFSFEGFVPAKSTARKKFYQSLVEQSSTLIFYESPRRIMDSLCDAITAFGKDRLAVIARELTKLHEEIKRDTLQNLYHWLQHNTEKQRGEFVLIIAGVKEKTAQNSVEARQIIQILLQELPTKKVAELVSEITGQKKNQLYQMALEIQQAK